MSLTEDPYNVVYDFITDPRNNPRIQPFDDAARRYFFTGIWFISTFQKTFEMLQDVLCLAHWQTQLKPDDKRTTVINTWCTVVSYIYGIEVVSYKIEGNTVTNVSVALSGVLANLATAMKETGAIGDHHSVRPPTLPSALPDVLTPLPAVDITPTPAKVSRNKKAKLRKKAQARKLQDLDPDPLLVIPPDAETGSFDAEMD